MNANHSHIAQLIIALVAYAIGYPNLGSIAIILTAPLCLYLVSRKDAGYIPALMVYCASTTSIVFCILFAIVAVCLMQKKEILSDKHKRIIFYSLLFTLPIYVILVYQRIIIDNDTWPAALSYSSYYLSFWCFLYGTLISNTYNRPICKLIVFTLLLSYVLFNLLRLAHGSRAFSIVVFIGILYGYHAITHKKVFSGIVVLLPSFFFFLKEAMTFTELLTVLFAFLIIILFNRSKFKTLYYATGIIPYFIILCVMLFAIISYDTVEIGNHSDHMDFSSLNAFWERAKFKIYDDRAVFWQAGLDQILNYHPVFPMHNIPNISIVTNSKYVEDISFGAHNTPLQLIRIFGLLMGTSLIFCYMKATSLGRLYLLNHPESISLEDILLIVILSNMIILFLTGTAAMLPVHALLYYSILGISYDKYSRQVR